MKIIMIRRAPGPFGKSQAPDGEVCASPPCHSEVLCTSAIPSRFCLDPNPLITRGETGRGVRRLTDRGSYAPSGFTQRVLPVGARRRLAPTSSLPTRTLQRVKKSRCSGGL